MRTRTRYASATHVATDSDYKVRSNPLPPTTIGEKRSRSQGDPGHDVQKHPRRKGSPAEGVSHTPTSSPTLSTLATSPDTGIGHDNDVASGFSPHGTGGSLSHRAASVVGVVRSEEHEKVLLELSGLRETLGNTQSALDAMQARVQAFKLGQARVQTLEMGQDRMECQLDLLIRMKQPVARPTYAAQAPLSSRKTETDMD